jgi:hypothetical protein
VSGVCGFVAVVVKRVCAGLLHSIQEAVSAGRSFIFEGGSKFLHQDTQLDPEGDGRTPI